MSIRLVNQESSSEAKSGEQLERAASELKTLLRELFRMRHEGASYEKLSHLQGMVDGYMKMMSDVGFMQQAELLQLVAEVRRGSHGPAVRHLRPSVGSESAAEVRQAIA